MTSETESWPICARAARCTDMVLAKADIFKKAVGGSNGAKGMDRCSGIRNSVVRAPPSLCGLSQILSADSGGAAVGS